MGLTQPTANITGHRLQALLALILPNLTTAQRNLIIAPDTGYIIFNTTTVQAEIWDGAAWIPIGVNYWQRVGIIVSPLTAGDSVSLGTGVLTESGGKTLIDANRKLAPVEILGTNLPANTGLIIPAIKVFGNSGANQCGFFWNGGRYGLTAFANTTVTGYVCSYFEGYGLTGICFHNNNGQELGITGSSIGCFHYGAFKLGTLAGVPTLNANMTVASGSTVDGLNLSVYGLAYLLNCEICNVTVAGTDPIAGDIDKEVLDDGVGVGWLRAYTAGAGYWLIELYTPGTIIANGSVLTITGGSAASKTTTGAGTVAPRLSQTTKPHRGKAKIGAGGTVTIYLDDLGTGAGNALYGKEPYIVAGYQGNGAAGVIPIGVTVAADRKSAVITGDANKYVTWVSLSEV
jgi:hypothetical protein